MPLEEGIVKPVVTDRSPRLGPLAIAAATGADFHMLRQLLHLPDKRNLYLSKICFDAQAPTSPSLVGPLMGAPYAVMVLETLRAWGVRTLVFIGWCGSIDPQLRSGDVLLPDSAVVDEGTSLHYGQETGGLVRPDACLLEALEKALTQRGLSHHKGKLWSTDGIFRETPGKIKKFQQDGALAVEMEVSALCSASRSLDVSFAAVLVVSDELFTLQWRPGFQERSFKQSRIALCNFTTETFAEFESWWT